MLAVCFTKQFPAVVHFSVLTEVLEIAACKQPFTSQECEWQLIFLAAVVAAAAAAVVDCSAVDDAAVAAAVVEASDVVASVVDESWTGVKVDPISLY